MKLTEFFYSPMAWGIGFFILTGCAGSTVIKQAEVTKPPYNPLALERFVDGIIDDMNGESESAINNYLEALRYDTTSNEIYASLAGNYMAQGKLEKSYGIINKILSRDAHHVESLEYLTEIYIKWHDYPRAVSALEQITKLDPTNIDARYRLIALMEFQGKTLEAAKYYEELIAILGPNALLSSKLGDLYMKNKMYDKAVKVYSQASQNEPNNIFLLDALAQSYVFNKDIPNAIATYETLVKIKEDDLVHARIGSLALQSADYPKALQHFKKAEISFPASADIKRSLGFTLYQLQRKKEAIEYLEKAVTINTVDVFSMSILSQLYQENKDYEKSDAMFDRILVIDSGNEAILNNYSYSLAVRGIRLDKALEMIQKALSKAPHNAHYLDTMGWIYYQSGQYELALKFVNQSYKIDDSSWEVADHLGDIYWKLKKPAEAKAFWERAFELNKDQSQILKKIHSLTIE